MGIRDNATKIMLGVFLIGGEDFKSVNFSPDFLFISDLTFNEKVKGVLSQLVKGGLLEKKDNSIYRLTVKGFSFLCTKFPFVRFLRESWDGKWRIISYEIPEIKRHLRDRLRREMEGWGLGPWHRSFWITPHPVIENLRELVLGKEEERYVQAFTAEHAFGNRDTLIRKVFKLDELEELYKDIFKRWHEILSSKDSNMDKLKKVVGEYVFALKKDPGLPQELVGSGWIGRESWKLFNEIKALLYVNNAG